MELNARRPAFARRPVPAPTGPDPLEPGLELLVGRLERRLAAREAGLVRREQDLQARIDEIRALGDAAPPEIDDGDLRRRERALHGRVAAVARREAELVRRESALERREAEAAARHVAEERRRAAAPGPVPVVGRPGSFNLLALERLVEAGCAAFPTRRAEWAAYLFHLREYADRDGILPSRFDPLVRDAFGDLLPVEA